MTGLWSFRFDDIEEIKRSRVANPNLSGVISPADALPPCYLPAHPEPPLVCPNSFADPRSIRGNLPWWQTDDTPMPSFETSGTDVLEPINENFEDWMMEFVENFSL